MCGCRNAGATGSREVPPATRNIPPQPATRSFPESRPMPPPAPAPAPASVPRTRHIGSPLAQISGGRRRGPPPAPTTTRTGLAIVDTSIWGAPLWRVLHTVAVLPAAPLEWIAGLRSSLPCPDCDAHYNAWCDARPPPSSEPAQWLLELHNNVNARRGVPTWSLEELTAQYAATPESVAAARSALLTLAGIIGSAAYNELNAALDTYQEPQPVETPEDLPVETEQPAVEETPSPA